MDEEGDANYKEYQRKIFTENQQQFQKSHKIPKNQKSHTFLEPL